MIDDVMMLKKEIEQHLKQNIGPIENKIEDPLSEAILRGQFKGMNKILISAVENEEGDMGLTFKAVHEEVPEEKPETPVGAGSSGEET